MGVLLRDGLIITVVGMGVVFAALALLWGVMAAMQRLLPEGEKPLAGLRRRRSTDGMPSGLPYPAPEAAAMASISVARGPIPIPPRL